MNIALLNIVEIFHRVFQEEGKAVYDLQDQNPPERIEKFVQILSECKGKIVACAVGKSGYVAQKWVGTLNSVSIPAAFLHATEAVHGDLGMVLPEDVVVFLSKSGQTEELLRTIPLVRERNVAVLAIVGNPESDLAKQADCFLQAVVAREVCPFNLAPTTSAIATLALCDAITVSLIHLKQLNEQAFARNHPAGALGKRLFLKVKDLAHTKFPKVPPTASLYRIVEEMTKGMLGCTLVMEPGTNKLLGIITDGDLRRWMKRHLDTFREVKWYQEQNQPIPPTLPLFDTAKDLMTPNPKTISAEALAYTALMKMEALEITQLVVMTPENENQVYGIIHLHDLLKEGIQ